jgi:hypothetical protein
VQFVIEVLSMGLMHWRRIPFVGGRFFARIMALPDVAVKAR